MSFCCAILPILDSLYFVFTLPLFPTLASFVATKSRLLIVPPVSCCNKSLTDWSFDTFGLFNLIPILLFIEFISNPFAFSKLEQANEV